MIKRLLFFIIILYFLVNSLTFAQVDPAPMHTGSEFSSKNCSDNPATFEHRCWVDTAWVKRYNETICGIDYATAIAVDSFGYVYETGWSGTSNIPDYLTIKISPIGETLWAQRYNGPGNAADWAYAIAVDNQGNVYVTGESEGLGTSYDYATVKYNSSGIEQWVARYNGSGNGEDYPCSVKVDNQGNVYVTGASEGLSSELDYATIKYNTDGVMQWIQRYNGTGNFDDMAYSLDIDVSGNVYVTGESDGGDTESDYLIIKYNTNGIQQWTARYDGTGESYDYAYAIAVDNQGNVYVTGSSDDDDTDDDYITIKYNSAGVQQWYRRYDGTGNDDDVAYALAIDDLGNVYVTGESYGNNDTYNYATIKYNSSGTRQWVSIYDGTGNDYAYALAIDDLGNVYITGESYGSNTSFDYATIKYNSNGVQQWVQRYNGTNNSAEYASAIIVDNQNNIYITGTSEGLNSEFDYLTLKYNTNGIQQWSNRYNGIGNSVDEATALSTDGSGNIYITGTSTGSGTNNDYLTIKYNANGVQEWIQRYNGTGNNADNAYSLAVDNLGNIYVTGESEGLGTDYDYATIKYSSVGNQEWVQRYNGPRNLYDWANCIAVDSAGDVYVTGGSEGLSTDYDFATIKYNSAGIEQWVIRYNGASNSIDYANSIVADNSGNVYVTGTSTGSGTSYDFMTIKYNSAGVEQWVQRYNGPANSSDAGYAITVDASGNVYATGRSYGIGTRRDYVTIKYNNQGIEQWIARYNGTGNSDDMAYAIAVDNSGNAYVTGESQGSGTSADYVTIKYSANGVEQWVQRYNGTGNETDIARSIVLDNQSNVYITGVSFDSQSNSDYVTIKYNSSGIQQWIKNYNGTRNRSDNACAIGIDNLNNIIVTGTSEGWGTSIDYATVKYIQTNSVNENREPHATDRLLLEAKPNPFRTLTTVRYSLPTESKISLVVFDISGRYVKTLVDEFKNAGVYSVNWNGTDNMGMRVGQGVYFYVLKTDSQNIQKKMLMLK
jgi:uncharacterized delta-60 repeat protein